MWERKELSAVAALVPLFDPDGRGLAVIRELALDVGVWRAQNAEEAARIAPGTPVILAASSERELYENRVLMRRHPTIVIGLGLGPRVWSIAKTMGAAGYVHDDLPASTLRAELSEALQRARGKVLATAS